MPLLVKRALVAAIGSVMERPPISCIVSLQDQLIDSLAKETE